MSRNLLWKVSRNLLAPALEGERRSFAATWRCMCSSGYRALSAICPKKLSNPPFNNPAYGPVNSRQNDRQTGTQTHRQTERQEDRLTDRQRETDRDTETEVWLILSCHLGTSKSSIAID